MDSKRLHLTPQKRSSWDVNSGYYKLRILLPNGISVITKIPEGCKSIGVRDLADLARKEHDRAATSPRVDVNWDADLSFVDDSDHVFKNSLRLTNLELNRVYNFRLHDGSKPAEIYENMWDLTPDTELLMELPEEYTFETALADLIDNSLQAVWSNGEEGRRLISVEIADDKISIFDTGPGMDSMSIEKWGKMGASLHRSYKTQAIGGKPPYLKPAFGMFGYGGFVASMHLGRYTEVSSKTKNCKKVYMLRLERDALVSSSGSKRTWRTYGSLRDPMDDEIELSPGGSFTKVDIFEPKIRGIDIRRLQFKLKDIYFPYIQCDDLSTKGRTATPVEFQVNGDDLAEVQGGEVAITNINSCNGPDFVLQLRFHLDNDDTTSQGARVFHEANARLRCVYLPVKEGNESILSILESLKEFGYEYTEDYRSFSHVSCRRLGRLLPDARWTWLPFMDFRQRKGDRTQVLKRSCMRVKCFIETDAGFNPTPSKTDFAHQNPFTTALRNLGSRQTVEKEMDTSRGVHIEITRDGKQLSLSQLDKQYQHWLQEMHEKYDEEVDCGTDEPVIIVNPINNKEFHVSKDAVRVHKALRRKGNFWKSGQKIKILKGACAGFHKTNVYATLEYILLEGFQGDAGEAWIICRTIDIPEEDGCLLKFVEGNPIFDLRKSVSLPISVIDSGKCLGIDDTEWNTQVNKQYLKSPSSIQILNTTQCRELEIEEVSLPDEAEVYSGDVSPREVVAVIHPPTFKFGTASKRLDQKCVMKDNFEMLLAITYSGNEKSQDEKTIYSGRVTPSTRKDFHGLYVFQPKCKSYPLFQKAGIYTFTCSIRDFSCETCVVKIRVNASREVNRWEALDKMIPYHLTVGCCCKPISVAMFDKYDNRIPFQEIPKMVVKVKCAKGAEVRVRKWKPSTTCDKLALILNDLFIESSNLNNIRPSYDATLMLCLSNGSHLLDIPVKVFPGLLERATVKPENLEKQLVPDHVIKEVILELFDAYGNCLQENQEVQVDVDGFSFLGRSCSLYKVDARGCIDLGGLLKVTAGYGRNVSLSFSSGGGFISKEWQIERRKLRSASMIPESCFAGSKLENLEFEVVNPDGEVDVNFHDEDEIGQSHTLVIKSEFMDIDASVKYVFRGGRCVVRAVPIPLEEGEFSFVAAHSRHLELQLTITVRVELPSEVGPFNTSMGYESVHNPLIAHPSADENMLQLDSIDTPMGYESVHVPETNASSALDIYHVKGVEPDLESFLDFQKELGDEVVDLCLRIRQHEDNIELLQRQQGAIESKLQELKDTRDQFLRFSTYGSPTKNEITARIECKADSAAALVMKISRGMSDEEIFGPIRMDHIIGVVALLGTTPNLELSRIFAEYLGDQMLAVVCKSYEDVRLLETYKKNGMLDRAHALHMFAAALGQSINSRYLVLCIEDIRPCEVGKDPEGKLLLANPTLPNGETPEGFLGYAVNLIDIDVDHLDTRTDSGRCLRETLFYRLFGEVQVYACREDMKKAISCIKDGAVSLDGGVLKGNGAVSLGCWEPDIIFPVAARRDHVFSEQNKSKKKKVVEHYNEMKLKLEDTKRELYKEKKGLEKTTKKCIKSRDMYAKYVTRRQPVTSSSSHAPQTPCLELKPFSNMPQPPPGYGYGYGYGYDYAEAYQKQSF